MGSSDRIALRQNQPCESLASLEHTGSFQPLILSTPYAEMPAPISVEFVLSPSAYIEDSFRLRIGSSKERYHSHFSDDNYLASSDSRDYEGRPNSPRLRSDFLKESIGFQSRFTDDNYRLSSNLRDYEGRPNSFAQRFDFLKDSKLGKVRFIDDNYQWSSDSRGYEGRPNSSRLCFKIPNDSGGYQTRYIDDSNWLSSNSMEYK